MSCDPSIPIIIDRYGNKFVHPQYRFLVEEYKKQNERKKCEKCNPVSHGALELICETCGTITPKDNQKIHLSPPTQPVMLVSPFGYSPVALPLMPRM